MPQADPATQASRETGLQRRGQAFEEAYLRPLRLCFRLRVKFMTNSLVLVGCRLFRLDGCKVGKFM